jgi:hypothetical protein
MLGSWRYQNVTKCDIVVTHLQHESTMNRPDRIAEYIETPGGVSSASLAEYWLGHAPLSNLARACVYIVIYVYTLR